MNNERSNTENEQQQALRAVIRRASWDVEFRAQCLRDPHAAILDETGYVVPDGEVIEFVDEPVAGRAEA